VKYNPPFGIDDPNAPYINGDPTIAREGSIPPAESIEYPQREIVNFIAKSSFIPSNGDLTQLTRATRSQYVNYCVDTGSVNALSVALDPMLQGYLQGLILRVKVGSTNTGPVTINVNGLGARPIKRANGADLVAGDIVAGGIANIVDDGTNFQILNFLGAIGGTTNNYNIDIPYAQDTGTPNTIIAAFTPPITAPVAGDLILVRLANVNTSAVNISVNALAPKAVRRTDGQPLQSRDHDFINEVILLEYNTAYWQMMRLVRSQVYFKLTADLVLWVRTDGNDNNDGSSNDAAHAFLHIQAAIDFVKKSFLIAGRTVTIRLGIPGTYTGTVYIDNLPGSIILRGDSANRSSYVVSFTPNSIEQLVLSVVGAGSNLEVDGVTFYNGSPDWNTCGIHYSASCYFHNVRFAGVAGASDIQNVGANVTLGDYIEFTRNAYIAIWTTGAGSMHIGTWFTLITVQNVTYSYSFFHVSTTSAVDMFSQFCGFSGTAYGRRYTVEMNSALNTHGGASTYLPGNQPGVADASSVYG
jgi:hypothetical protein